MIMIHETDDVGDVWRLCRVQRIPDDDRNCVMERYRLVGFGLTFPDWQGFARFQAHAQRKGHPSSRIILHEFHLGSRSLFNGSLHGG